MYRKNKLADKLYDSVTVFFELRRKYVFQIVCKCVRTRTRGALQHTHRPTAAPQGQSCLKKLWACLEKYYSGNPIRT